MNFIIKMLIIVNVISVPLTILITPFFISFTEMMAYCPYCDVETQMQLNNVIDDSKWKLYILPIVLTNVIVISVTGVKLWYYNRTQQDMIKK